MQDLSIVVPTYNERANLERLLDRLERTLSEVNWELIIIDDDSPDGTAQKARELSFNRNNLRIIQRVARRGLSSACIEGIMSSSAPYCAIMDADLQHNETLLPKMLELLMGGDYDVVVGSRFMKESSASGGLSQKREKASNLANWLSQFFLKGLKLSDPMSGFFMLNTNFFHKYVRQLSGRGFKILFDLCNTSAKDVRIAELPYHMCAREFGHSKMDFRTAIDFIALLFENSIGRIIPLRFILFVLVGLVGLILHIIILFVFFTVLKFSFLYSQTIATFLAMTNNFLLNNAFTYHDLKLKGFKLILGLFSFYLICGLGAIINLIFANHLFELGAHWSLAGAVGAGISSIWNYAVSSTFTWKAYNKK
jgi:dolichol-phosphate mannosyltransferase